MAPLFLEFAADRSLTLTGPGGSGKTRLALELASEVVPEHADGVWFIELGPVSGPHLVPQAVADGLHLKEQASRRLAETLADHLRERRSLLVLDKCEHVVDTVAELTVELLKQCEGLKVLATSRPRHGEHSVGNCSLGDERLQQVQGRRKEKGAGDRPTEVEQAIVVARGSAHEHVLEHLLDRAG